MTGRDSRLAGIGVLLAALGMRLGGIAVTTLTDLNSYALYDADRFAARAAELATSISNGQMPPLPSDPNNIVALWGLVLSPLWILPGPNRLYGRLSTAVLGAVAAYLVYRLGTDVHSRRAGVLAALPLVGYPSYVFVHSTVLREAFLLTGLVWATSVLAGTPRRPENHWVRYALAAVILAVTTLFRWENAPVYLLVLATAAVVQYRAAIPRPRALAATTTVGVITAGLLGRPAVRSVLGWLSHKRYKRSEGRTVYLQEFRPDTIPKAVLFAPVGAIYFLFTPFPWMVATIADVVVLVEAIVNLVAFGFALLGAPIVWRRSPPTAAALGVGFVVAAVLYGLVNANVGTVVRQRQMVLWVLFLFAGVAVADRTDADQWPDWLQ